MAQSHRVPNGPFKDQHSPVPTQTLASTSQISAEITASPIPLMDLEVPPPAPGKRPVEEDPINAWSTVTQRPKKVKSKAPPPTPVSNKFHILSRHPAPESTTPTSKPPSSEPTSNDPDLPPPIILDAGYPHREIRTALANLKIENFELQTTRRGIKLFLKSYQNYVDAVTALIDTHLGTNPVKFHTFAPKGSGPNKKFLILGLDEDHNLESIKTALAHDDLIDVRRLTTVRDGRRLETANVLVTFKPNYEPKEHLAKLKVIDNVMFRFKPFAANRALPTCLRCQQIGHTKRYCYRDPKCVKCGAEHEEGPTCSPDAPPRCCNCDGPHLASYRQCPARLRLLQKRSASKSQSQNPPKSNKTTTFKPAPPPTSSVWDNHLPTSHGARSASHHLFPESRPSTSQVPPFSPPESHPTSQPSWLQVLSDTLVSMIKELSEAVKTLVAALPHFVANK